MQIFKETTPKKLNNEICENFTCDMMLISGSKLERNSRQRNNFLNHLSALRMNKTEEMKKKSNVVKLFFTSH